MAVTKCSFCRYTVPGTSERALPTSQALSVRAKLVPNHLAACRACTVKELTCAMHATESFANQNHRIRYPLPIVTRTVRTRKVRTPVVH